MPPATPDVLANRFIFRRDRLRGLAHLLIMWGCAFAVAITFPLVFGWFYFQPVPGELRLPGFSCSSRLRACVLGLSRTGVASFLVIVGVMLAMRGACAKVARRRSSALPKTSAAAVALRREPDGAHAHCLLHVDEVPDMGATGVQGSFVGSRYVDSGQYRPSANSIMNFH